MNRDVDDLLFPASAVAFYASGWLVSHTAVPAEWRAHASVLMLVVGAAGVIGAARALGIELEGGRCRARTTDGDRCSLSRDAGDDLCHVHKRVHGVELHASAVDGTVAADDVDDADD